jgi:hypothetical protein
LADELKEQPRYFTTPLFGGGAATRPVVRLSYPVYKGREQLAVGFNGVLPGKATGNKFPPNKIYRGT